MSYQTCPICNGTGTYYPVGYSDAQPCPTCNGKRIINEITGKPPDDNPKKG
jgi:DnaJ-class molecular chaperone